MFNANAMDVVEFHFGQPKTQPSEFLGVAASFSIPLRASWTVRTVKKVPSRYGGVTVPTIRWLSVLSALQPICVQRLLKNVTNNQSDYCAPQAASGETPLLSVDHNHRYQPCMCLATAQGQIPVLKCILAELCWGFELLVGYFHVDTRLQISQFSVQSGRDPAKLGTNLWKKVHGPSKSATCKY